ncbi:MAG TPA: DUF3618 domain-containing protein [Acetobacteraceae bacterium]|nr:DUF3618 domain-containing protein [Acetobacteraceae bacterium]
MSDHADDPAVIERDLRATRARLDHRLSELSQRLSPGQLVDEALVYLRTSGGAEFARHLGETARERPMPVVLAGIGIAWLMMAGPRPHERVVYREGTVRRPPYRSGMGGDGADHWPGQTHEDDPVRRAWEAGKAVARQDSESDTDFRARVTEARGKALGVARQAQDTAQSFADRVEEALFAARDSVVEGVQGAAGWVGGTAQGLRDTASDMTDRMSRQANRLGTTANDSYERAREVAGRGTDVLGMIAANPVLLGSLGVLSGAVLGALLPPTEIEREYLGQTADRARRTVANVTQDALDRGASVAGSAMEAVADAGDRAVAELDRRTAGRGDGAEPAQR